MGMGGINARIFLAKLRRKISINRYAYGNVNVHIFRMSLQNGRSANRYGVGDTATRIYGMEIPKRIRKMVTIMEEIMDSCLV